MKKLITWLDNNILKIGLVGYIFFIPLYPKLPLQMVDYTYIAIRLEDIFIAILYGIFLVQLLRKKVTLNTAFLVLFVLFWISIFISFFLGFFVQHTIVIKNVGFLNTLRRIEYMSIFFVFASTVKTRKDFIFYLRFILVTIVLVTLYGLGQKYLGWPAVQTMNPEYAKGYLLILDSWARISSTFGGHYDLSAFLLFFMPLLLALTVKVNKWFYIVFLLALSNLVLAASRVSYGAYILSIFPFLFIFPSGKVNKWHYLLFLVPLANLALTFIDKTPTATAYIVHLLPKVYQTLEVSMVIAVLPLLLFYRKWPLFILTIIATFGLTMLSGNLTQRINRTFQTKQIYISKTTGQTTVPRRLQPDDLPVGDYIIDKKGADSRAVDVGSGAIDINSKDAREVRLNLLDEIRKEAKKTGRILTQEEENKLLNEAYNNMKVVSAVIPDISVATRLQVEWPRAINAFLKYPIFGKGPSSITEATDNDYLRWLGEFGFVGTLIFMFILGKLAWNLLIAAIDKPSDRMIIGGLLAGFIGLSINALMIDIFEASKVAFTFWMVMGMIVGYLSNSKLKTS